LNKIATKRSLTEENSAISSRNMKNELKGMCMNTKSDLTRASKNLKTIY